MSVKCFYCIHINAAYEIVQTTVIVGKEYTYTAQVCESCMPVDKYLLKEYKCL